MIRIQLPAPLHPIAQTKSVEVSASNVGEALQKLVDQLPQIKSALFTDSGALNKFVVTFLNGEDIRYQENLQTNLKDRDVITLVVAVAGG